MDTHTRAQQLAARLDAYAAQYVPSDLDLWPRIQAAQPARYEPPSPHVRVVFGSAVLVSVLLLSVGLLALLAPWAGAGKPGVQAIATPYVPAFVPPPVSQTIHGYTATLQPLWADANRITFRVVITNPQGTASLAPYSLPAGEPPLPSAQLTGATGRVYPHLWAAPPAFGGISHGFSAVQVWSFEPDPPQGTPSVLHLHFTLPLRASYLAPPEATRTLPAVAPQPTLQPLPQPVDLPFAFDFQLPFDPLSRRVEVQQTVAAQGVAISLKQVVITRREARAFFQIHPLTPATQGEWSPVIVDWPASGDQNVEFFTPPNGQPAAPATWTTLPPGSQISSSLRASFLDAPAEWPLTVTDLADLSGNLENLRGFWRFQVHMPPSPTPTLP